MPNNKHKSSEICQKYRHPKSERITRYYRMFYICFCVLMTFLSFTIRARTHGQRAKLILVQYNMNVYTLTVVYSYRKEGQNLIYLLHVCFFFLCSTVWNNDEKICAINWKSFTLSHTNHHSFKCEWINCGFYSNDFDWLRLLFAFYFPFVSSWVLH